MMACKTSSVQRVYLDNKEVFNVELDILAIVLIV